MDNYNYQSKLKEIWDLAFTKYKNGDRNPDNYFSEITLKVLRQMGLKTMDIYDYIEDNITSGEPDFETFLLVSATRRDYFLTVQNGRTSKKIIDCTSLPEKEAKIDGIVWLPRIIVKAQAKLRGELPPQMMYGCGGDRHFFRSHNIHPADFLRAAWTHESKTSKLVDWIKTKSPLN